MKRETISEKEAFVASQQKKEEKYWLNKLSDFLEKCSFPYDHKNSKTLENPTVSIKFTLAEKVTSKLMELSHHQDHRLHMILVAGLVTLLNQYTGNRDITVGIPIYKQHVQGDFINTMLPIRSQMPEWITFKELLLQLNNAIYEAIRHQNYPLETIVRQLNMPYNKTDFPLFDMAILLENIHDKTYIHPLKLNMIFSFLRNDKSIRLVLEYNSSLYNKITIEKIIEHLMLLLEKTTADINRHLSGVDFLSDNEKQQLLVELNDSKTIYPKDKTIHELLEEQVANDPDSIAIIYKDMQFTYNQLNQEANRLARLLKRMGVGPDSIVAIMVNRSPAMIIGIFAILKAGGAYLPIDPGDPRSRIISVMDDCNASILLTETDIINQHTFTGLQNIQAIKTKLMVTSRRPQIKDLDHFIMPDRSLVDYEKYSRFLGLAMVKDGFSMQATRGCPYNCAYCHKIWPKSHVFRSAEHIFAEVKLYYDMGVRRFAFIDDIFNLNRKNSMRFFDLVIKNRLDIQIFFPNGVRGDILTSDYIDRMIEAGTVYIGLALETASPRIQKLIGKNLHLDKFRENAEYVANKYPNIILDLFTMHGFPSETEEEATMTLDFIKSVKWFHFPYVFILKVYPNTDMAKLAIENGVSSEAIYRSQDKLYHELPDTLPFEKSFTLNYQSDFFNNYFLNKERLLQVLPYQMKTFTEKELVEEYSGYLPKWVNSFTSLLHSLGIKKEELKAEFSRTEAHYIVPDLNQKISNAFPAKKPAKNALRVLLLDLSQNFSTNQDRLKFHIEAPLGLMYILTYINQQFGSKVQGKIAKSMIDFDNYAELKKLLENFKPDIIGLRTLNVYKNFFHQTISVIRQQGIDVPIIAGGPYATSAYSTMLQDRNIDLAVLGEGEITFGQLIGEIIKNEGRLPDEETLNKINGIAFIPNSQKSTQRSTPQIVMLDTIPGLLSKEPTQNLAPVARPDNLAYVMYTSGSTGRPKGTLTQHYNVNRVVCATNYLEIKKQDVLLQLSNYAFDGSVFDIYGSLLNGAKLVIINELEVLSIESVGELIKKEGVTVFFITTALFNMLVDMSLKSLKNIRKVLFGGERVSPEHTGNAWKYLGKHHIIHMYGPTETTVYATYYPVNEIDTGSSTIPIGRPLANTVIYILNYKKQPVPINVPGELYIGGDGCSRGYLNNPELTMEKFATNPFIKGDRLYKTGDLAKWLHDGNIEFIGRIDQQVKIRGFRIEPGEVENHLRKLDSIKEAVVAVIENRKGEKKLCAYYVPADTGKSPEIFELKDRLSAQLPDFMIPTHFIQLNQLPLTVNKKVDMKALPDPEAGNFGGDYIAPRDEMEEKFVKIWSEVLGIDQELIGINHDFFTLGGHSLNSTVLVSRIHQEFDVKVPLTEIFHTPTIRELSGYIKEKSKDKHESIEAVPEKDYYVLSSAQRRLYVLQQMESSLAVYNIPIALMIEGNADKVRFEEVLRKLIKRHESLRTSFHVVNDEPMQRIHPRVDFAIEYDEAGENEIHHMIKHFIRAFDLSQAPLLRVGMLKIRERKHILLVDMHHIITDGISMALFTKEFITLYEDGQLDPLRIQYKDFSQWWNQQKYLEKLKKQEGYWLKQFEVKIPVLNLPTDYPRPVVQSFKGSHRKFQLSRKETQLVKTIASETDATLYMLVLALFNVLLSKLSGDKDIIIGTPIAGRSHTDSQKIIGMFVNTLAIRNYPTGTKRFKEFLLEVKKSSLQAFENQDYPFEDLVEKVSVDRNTGRNPIFDVVFTFQNIGIPDIQLPGLKLKQYEYDYGIAKFDLTLNMVETEDNLALVVEYCTELFASGTIERYINYFKKILSSVLVNPEVKIEEIEIISEKEKKQVLFDFNHTKTRYPEEQTIHELFEKQVEKTPDHMALVFEDKALTYRTVNEKTNQLAGILREKGVSPGGVVGIIMERSIEMILGLIAILKSGGAYLSIAPDYPENRILSILNDSGVQLLLTNGGCIKPLNFLLLRNIRSGHVNGVITPPRPPIKDFNELPIPDRTLVNYSKYHNNIGNAPVKNAITLQSSRGCPFNCMFCHKIWPKQHIVRSAESIFEEVRCSYDAGVRRFVFLDDIFNLDKENSSRFLQKIIKNRLHVQLFFPNGLRGDILTKDYIDLLVEAGTVNFSVALETASPRIQKLIRKNLNIGKFQENLDYITKTYPHIILEMELMFGFPTETEEEALLTFDFLKNLKWIHFPNLNILKIYPNTDMSKIAIENGIPEKLIERSSKLAFHELPETLPFPKSFARQYQARFLSEYFLSKERLLHILPFQLKTLSEDELVKKYDSYLPASIQCFPDILKTAGINETELKNESFLPEGAAVIPDFQEKIKEHFPSQKKADDALSVLLLDLSQLFSGEAEGMLYDVVEAPLGLMYLLTYINKEFGSKVKGKIAKSRIDFDSFDDLKRLIDDFQPQVIGIRTLSYYNDLFHKTVSLIKWWSPDIPIISGGPYSTTDYQTILSDIDVDVIVIGEGEVTFAELLREMIKNQGKLPGDQVLAQIPGIAFLPRQHKPVKGNRHPGREVLLLDRIIEQINTGETKETKNPIPLSCVNDLAYVLYTSGSTGKPKGVAMAHYPLFNLILWQFQKENYSKGASTLQFTPYTFDVSFQEIFSTLCSGGELVLISEEMRRDMLRLLDFLEERNIERLFLPFVALQQLTKLAQDTGQVPLHLREIITAGERLKITPSISNFFKRLKNCVLHNQYGPTESHVVTAFTMTGAVHQWPTFPPIGYPIANSRIYLLDGYGKLAPIGVAGELFIGGDSLARGYLNKPELTAEKFTEQVEAVTGAGDRCKWKQKIYKTGDLARWLPDGNIEFLGRIDHQVKIRGFRVEPGEIENHLLNHDSIKEVVVLLKSRIIPGLEEEDNNYLTAYIVADKELKTSQLREYLSRQLPEYMVPTFFRQIDKIPLTATGKADRKALPGLEGVEGGPGYIKPRDKIEEKLTLLWSETLGIAREFIGINANFFELGGHSLKATTLASKMHKEFGVKIPLVEIFRTPSIIGLSGYIKASAPEKYISIKPVEKRKFYAVSSAQKRLYLMQQMIPENTGYNMPQMVELKGPQNPGGIEKIFRELIRRQESLRTSFHTINGEPVQKIHREVEFSIELPTISDFVRPFDLSQAPLLRVGLIKVNESKHLLLFDMHHIITDGTSQNVLYKEFMALYAGEELPPVKLQYKDYTDWHHKLQASEKIKAQEKYWLEHLHGDLPRLNLPTDFSRPTGLNFKGDMVLFEVHHELTKKIKEIGLKSESTTYIVLLSVFNVLLSKLTEQEDIIVGCPIAGRPHNDLQDIVGMFVNMLALRNRQKANMTFWQFLTGVKENTLKAYKNQDYQFEELIEKLNFQRQPGRHALIDTVILLHNQNEPLPMEQSYHANPGSDLDGNSTHLHQVTSKFDLELHALEADNKIKMVLIYDVHLFRRSTVVKFTELYMNILQQITENLDIILEDIKISCDFQPAETVFPGDMEFELSS